MYCMIDWVVLFVILLSIWYVWLNSFSEVRIWRMRIRIVVGLSCGRVMD